MAPCSSSLQQHLLLQLIGELPNADLLTSFVVSNAKTCKRTSVKTPQDYIPIMLHLHPILTSLFS